MSDSKWEFAPDSKVIWTYTHHTNSRTSFKREKRGIYWGPIRYRPGGLYGPLQYHPNLVHVQFPGNKYPSKVSKYDLRLDLEEA